MPVEKCSECGVSSVDPQEWAKVVRERIGKHKGNYKAAKWHANDMMVRLLHAIGYSEGMRVIHDIDFWEDGDNDNSDDA